MMPLTCPPERSPFLSAGDPLHLRVEIHPGVPALAEVSGEIDIASASWLRERLLLAIRRHGPALCVDLHAVTFLDCSGVTVLLATARRASLEGGWMRVTRPSKPAWRVITLLGLHDVLKVSPAPSVPAIKQQTREGRSGGEGRCRGTG
jgi:anti-sigma B factor antagonist